jgi:hypothetical protein
LRLGLNNPVTYLELLRLAKYSTQGREIIQNLRIKFKRFKQDFFGKQKPYLARQGETKAIKRMERKLILFTKLLRGQGL